MGCSYSQLDDFERVTIQIQLQLGWRAAAIAAGLKRSRSTVTRELRRNGWKPASESSPQSRRWGNGGYVARRASQRARILHRKPRVARKLVVGTPLWDQVLFHLGRGLSPEQVAFTLMRMPEPVRLSHETIYTALYAMPRGELRARVMTLLRRRRLSRRSRSKTGVDAATRKGFIESFQLIDHRPEEVDQRLVPGHWEGDLIKGRLNQSCVGVLVERTTLYVALVKLEDGSAKTCAEGFARILNRFDATMRKTMTYDQGREMAQHKWLHEQTGVKVYFAHPHSPWERGINENTNGLLRQFLPKGEDLSRFSQQDLDDIALLMNARIRKSLKKKAPAELFLPEGAFDFVQFWQNPAKFTNVALGA
ncbi:IS30 family transposase [Terriglobus albidus]|uniref:IS30 family transposase n=1 Tax=Terriglobus albidus TaxID=1592106 RepID=UPI0021E0EFCD|nr:IS30 family transposase [Terriglobus albidus]